MSFIKVNKIQNLGSAGDGLVIDNKGTVGIATTSTTPDLVGSGAVSYTHLTLPTMS